jgi:integrase
VKSNTLQPVSISPAEPNCSLHQWDSTHRRASIYCLLLTVATLAVYLPVLHCSFVNLDDPAYVVKNHHIRQLNWQLPQAMQEKTAKAWGYASHNPFDGLVLPRVTNQRRFFFTVDEIKRIISAAAEPEKTLFWLAAETGMRAGELFGLRVEDVDLDGCVISVVQTAWRELIQSPKTKNSIRQFAISPALSSHLRFFLTTWRPNLLGLVFATRGGNPLDRGNFVIRKLRPLLDSLGIKRCGMHAFRHTNGSLMDQLNAPMKIRQERLGHAPGSDITMAVYTHVLGEGDRQVAQQLGDILRPSVPKLSHSENMRSEPVTIQ